MSHSGFDKLMPNCWLIWDTSLAGYAFDPTLVHFVQSRDVVRNIMSVSICFLAKGYHCGRHD